MSEARLVEFHALEFMTDSSADRRCPALLSPGKDRCSALFSLDSASKIRALYGRLHDDDETDNAARAQILEQIAKLCLCEAHGQDCNITAAILKWKSYIQSPVRHPEPRTPTAKNVQGQSQIIFTNYTPEKSKINLDDPKHIDREVRRVLGGRIENEDKNMSHLYVFSYGCAEGLYKIGRGQQITRVTEQAKCYPGLEVHCFIECPNAKLFESVVHQELRQYRRKHTCTKCKNKPVEHGEWFNAPLRDILDSVTAWSLYARKFYGDGLSTDGYYQNLPTPGFLSRPDRWRRWALAETMRWMDRVPNQVAIVPERSVPTEPTEIDEPEPIDESGSDAASIFSSRGSLSDTPGTTPGMTPLTESESSDHKRDYYSLSPAPARKNTSSVNLLAEDENENDWDNSHQPVKRALFTSPPSKEPKDPQSTSGGRVANSDANSASHTSSTDVPLTSSTSVDVRVRAVLEDGGGHSKRPGTIYLTPSHPEKESHKIYFRQKGASRAKECYSNPDPYFEIECTNTERIQKLVLAEFGDRTHQDRCGTGGCSTKHRGWINAPGNDIKASLRAWTALMEVGYDRTDVPGENFSRGANRWRKWAMETAERNGVTKGRKQPAGEEELPTDVLTTSVDDPPRPRRAATDFVLGSNSREAGGGRTSRLLRRVSTFIEKTEKSKVSRPDWLRDMGRRAVRRVVKS
ncbi:hypothetical protein BDW66DRAFT_155272 [Aspergillus desertorum]